MGDLWLTQCRSVTLADLTPLSLLRLLFFSPIPIFSFFRPFPYHAIYLCFILRFWFLPHCNIPSFLPFRNFAVYLPCSSVFLPFHIFFSSSSPNFRSSFFLTYFLSSFCFLPTAVLFVSFSTPSSLVLVASFSIPLHVRVFCSSLTLFLYFSCSLSVH